MERVTNHERPGVYSAYTATAAAQRGNRRGIAAVIAESRKGTAGTLYALGSYRQAAETFGAEDGLTALMVTHNMRDAIAHGNRLIMMNAGKIILDVSGEDKRKLTVEDLLDAFAKLSGSEFANDRALLS